MPIDVPLDTLLHAAPQDGEDPALHRIRQRESALFELNERIARLALLLDAPLRSEEDLHRILARELPVFAYGHGGSVAAGTGHRRTRVEWEELRGLLAMRCDLMAQTLAELGLDATRQLTQLVEERLSRVGFTKGADGFVLLARLNRDDR